jgi:hypothetical protein
MTADELALLGDETAGSNIIDLPNKPGINRYMLIGEAVRSALIAPSEQAHCAHSADDQACLCARSEL